MKASLIYKLLCKLGIPKLLCKLGIPKVFCKLVVRKLLCRLGIHEYDTHICPSTHLQFPYNKVPYRYQKHHHDCVYCDHHFWKECNKTDLDLEDD